MGGAARVVAFIASIIFTIAMTLLVVPVAKRRPVGTPLTWGEAMVAATWVFAILFLAYGVVPHQWLDWASNELKWRSDRQFHGLGGIVKSQASGGWFPFTIDYRHLMDIVATLIYGVFLGLQIALWMWWQKRGSKPASAEVEVSGYGRPLVRKG
jgi:hypothetical protein